MAIDFVRNLLALVLEAAPWVVLGLLVAGLIKAGLPMAGLAARLQGRGLAAVGGAALLGAPLPLCSCGVLPAAFGLRRAGASKGATTSFLISTPETGVDSVLLSYVLLGPVFAVVRPVVAVASAIFTGLAVAVAIRDEAAPFSAPQPAEGCCCGEMAEERTGLIAGLRYAFADLWDDIALWLAGGLLAAAVVVTVAPPDVLAAWAQGPLAMLVVLAVSVPMYVCASASTPLALALLHAGVSPGTALVFLLAGPATNLAGLALVRRELGGATMAIYLAGVVLTSLAAGLALDAIWRAAAWPLPAAPAGQAESGYHLWLGLASALLLLLAYRPIRRRILPASAAPAPGHDHA